jgi:sugar phosphate isomerase/epimerase
VTYEFFNVIIRGVAKTQEIFMNHSIILGNVGNFSDRYMGCSYQRDYSIHEMFDRVRSVKGVTGVELVSNWQITAKNCKEVKAEMERTGLKLVSIIPDHFGIKVYGKGAFTSKDPKVRAKAVEDTKEMMDIAHELGGNLVSLWPGQDGYDYHFQGDYIEERGWFEEGVKQCCQYRRDVNVSIEYKPKEPRNFSYPANVTGTLLMIDHMGEKNLGVTIDYGHGAVAGENLAESVALCKMYGDKLLHVHMNDNYGHWDDDMITASIHTIPFIEFFYWLKKTGYSHFISTDQYPYREDGRDACNESVRWFDILEGIADKIDEKRMKEIWKTGNACEVSAMLRDVMFGDKTE